MNGREISEGRTDTFDGSVERRQVVARGWLKRAKSSLQRLQDSREATARTFRETYEVWFGRVCPPDERPTVIVELQSKADRMRICAYAATALEVIFAALVAIWSLNFAAYVSALAGAIVAVLLVLTVEGVHLRLYQPDHPAASRAVVERWLKVSFAVFGLGIIPLIVSRTVPAAAVLANASVALVTVGITLTGAFLFILSFILSWSKRFARRYDAILQEIHETEQFAGELEDLLRQEEVRIMTLAR